MSFYSHHGCFKAERIIGTHFCVDLSMRVETTLAQKSDNLQHTVNYADVYQAVKSEMDIPSHLLEHVANRICESVLCRFPSVESVTVRVSKCHPPLGGKIDSVSVEIEMLRNC